MPDAKAPAAPARAPIDKVKAGVAGDQWCPGDHESVKRGPAWFSRFRSAGGTPPASRQERRVTWRGELNLHVRDFSSVGLTGFEPATP